MTEQNLIHVSWGMYGKDVPWGGSTITEIRENLIKECGTPNIFWGFAPPYTWSAFRGSEILSDEDVVQSGEEIEFHRPPKPIIPPDPPKVSLWQQAKKLLSK